MSTERARQVARYISEGDTAVYDGGNAQAVLAVCDRVDNLEAEVAALRAPRAKFPQPGICRRIDDHDGPCNGFPRTSCPGYR